MALRHSILLQDVIQPVAEVTPRRLDCGLQTLHRQICSCVANNKLTLTVMVREPEDHRGQMTPPQKFTWGSNMVF